AQPAASPAAPARRQPEPPPSDDLFGLDLGPPRAATPARDQRRPETRKPEPAPAAKRPSGETQRRPAEPDFFDPFGPGDPFAPEAEKTAAGLSLKPPEKKPERSTTRKQPGPQA